VNIAIVGPSPVPYTRGGIENFLAALFRTINDHTSHNAELIKIPIREQTVMQVIHAYWKFANLDLNHFDLVITSKYPAWMVRHKNHVLYLGHTLRGLYDTYPGDVQKEKLWKHSFFQFPGPWIRKIVHWLDSRAFSNERISHVFCFSKTVAGRSEYFNPEMPPKIVYCSTVRDDYFCGSGDYLFTVSRLDPPKRIDLLIKAYRKVPGEIEFLIAGTGSQESYLHEIAKDDHRIRFLGNISEDALLKYYADSLGVLYIPVNEDLGLITLEAMRSSKPVITAIDSGGPLEFVEDNVNGFICNPDVDSIADRISQLLSDPVIAADMGRRGNDKVSGITWNSAVNTILAPYKDWPARSSRKAGERRRIMALVPYPVHPPRSGGPRRVASLYQELSKVYDVWLLTVGRHGTDSISTEINPFLHEVRIAVTDIHARKEWAIEKELGLAVTDILLPDLIRLTPNFTRAVEYFLECSDIAISSHPYLHSLLNKSDRCRLIVHESHNFEWMLKKSALPDTDMGRKLKTSVFATERAAITGADLVLSTSEQEADQLSSEYSAEAGLIVIAPNGVDINAVSPPDIGQREVCRKRFGYSNEFVALFIGAWHPPNLEAFRFILEKLVPVLPGIHFLIIGSVKAQYETRVGEVNPPANCRVMGEVDDQTLQSALLAADTGLNPMFSGSGTNLKILEYFAAGLPVIATPEGIRGLDVTPEKDVLVCSAHDFQDCLMNLSVTANLQKSLAKAGRKLVEKTYGWETIGRKVTRKIESRFPVLGIPGICIEENQNFLWGWFALEDWSDRRKPKPLKVRWSSPESEMQIPDLRCVSRLVFDFLGGPVAGKLKIRVDDILKVEKEVTDQWVHLEIEIQPGIGVDFHSVRISAPSWSPSESGSPDIRQLGVAISNLRLEATK